MERRRDGRWLNARRTPAALTLDFAVRGQYTRASVGRRELDAVDAVQTRDECKRERRNRSSQPVLAGKAIASRA